MSHDPRPPPVANPLVLVLTGSRAEAVEREEVLRRSFNAGLQRWAEDAMADRPTLDPAAALETLADCAPVAFTRYNGDNNLTPTPGTPLDEVWRQPKIKIAHPKTAKPPRESCEGLLGTFESRRPSLR